MKSKCSFILRAGTALALCFLMLFSTMATSLAAVVDDLAATGGWAWNTKYYVGDTISDTWGKSASKSIAAANTSVKSYDYYLTHDDDDLYVRFHSDSDNNGLQPSSDGEMLDTSSNKKNISWGTTNSWLYKPSWLTNDGKFYKITISADLSLNNWNGQMYYAKSSLSDISPSVTSNSSSILKGNSVTLTGAKSASVGTVTYKYEYSTDQTNWTEIGSSTSTQSWTPSSVGTYYVRVEATDGGVIVGKNAYTARTEISDSIQIDVASSDPYITLDGESGDTTAELTYYTGSDSVSGNSDYNGSQTITVNSGNLSDNISVSVADTGIVSLGASTVTGIASITKNTPGSFTLYPKGVGSTTVTVSSGSISYTVSVTVTDYDPYDYVYFSNAASWSTVKVHMYTADSSSNNGGWPGQAMTKIGKNSSNEDVYAYKYLKSSNFRYAIFNNGSSGEGNQSQTCDLNSASAFYYKNSSTYGTWTLSLTKPTAITMANVSVDYGSTATATATVTGSTAGVYFKSGTTANATVSPASDTSSPYQTTVTAVAIGSSTLTAYAFPAKPSNISSFSFTEAAGELIGIKATATATVAATTRKVTVNQKYRDSSSAPFTDGVKGTATVSYTNSSGTSASGTISTQGGYVSALNKTGVSITVAPTANNGYRFLGWSTDGSTVGSAGTYSIAAAELTSDKTVYAMFGKGANISFVDSADFSGASLKASAFYYYDTNMNSNAPADPGHAGYTLTGWSNGTTTYNVGSLPNVSGNSDITYTAVYNKTKYSVTVVEYITTSTDATPAAATYSLNESGTAIATYSGTGTDFQYSGTTAPTTTISGGADTTRYQFIGYYASTSATSTTNVSNMSVTENKTIIARYRERTYSVIGNFDGKDFVTDYDMVYNSSTGTYTVAISGLDDNKTYSFKVRQRHSYDAGTNLGAQSYTATATKTLTNNIETNATLKTTFSGEYVFEFTPNTTLKITYPERHVTLAVSPAAASSLATESAWTGDNKSFTATENDTYRFNSWTISGGTSGTDYNLTGDLTDASITLEALRDTSITVTANFSLREASTITLNSAYTTNGTTYSSVSNNLVSYSSDGTTYTTGTSASVNYNQGLYIKALSTYTLDGRTYEFEGWVDASGNAVEDTDGVVHLENIKDDAAYTARYKAQFYITLYNSYTYDQEKNDYIFDAAPPRTVVIGDGTTTRATYTYAKGTLSQCGEDNLYGVGYDATDPSYDPNAHVISANGAATYYEGNKILVYAGETVKLNYTNLATSDAIGGVFYNNSIRYTTNDEDDDLFKNRVYKAGGWGSESDDTYGTADGTPYTMIAATDTLFADAAYYTDKASTINAQTYAATVNQDSHTVTIASVEKNYLNIDFARISKQKVTINNNDESGIAITGMNTEGYYFSGETGMDIKVALDNSDTTRSYSFTGEYSAMDSTDAAVSGFTVTAYDSSDAVVADPVANAASVSYFKITCTAMPSKDVYINLGISEKLNMKLSNVVVSDTIDHKVMANQTNDKNYTVGSTAESSATGHIGTVTARVNDATSGVDIAYENESTYHW